MYLESYKQLEVWKRSMELAKEIYEMTDQFPKTEIYGLVSQMRRAAVLIPSNIAEGYKKKEHWGIHSVPQHCRRFSRRIRNANFAFKRFISESRPWKGRGPVGRSSENAYGRNL